MNFLQKKALSVEARGFLLGEGLFDLEFLITRKDSARLRRVLNLEEKGTRQRRAPSGLSAPILQKLNRMLPLVIMLLLLFTSLSMPKNGEGFALFFAQILALGCVVGSYIWLKNTFLSVALGIAGLNGFLWLLG